MAIVQENAVHPAALTQLGSKRSVARNGPLPERRSIPIRGLNPKSKLQLPDSSRESPQIGSYEGKLQSNFQLLLYRLRPILK